MRITHGTLSIMQIGKNKKGKIKMTPLEQLLKRLPKKYHNRVENIERESDLIGDCKYMLYFAEGFIDENNYGYSCPVKSITEAIDIIKHCI